MARQSGTPAWPNLCTARCARSSIARQRRRIRCAAPWNGVPRLRREDGAGAVRLPRGRDPQGGVRHGVEAVQPARPIRVLIRSPLTALGKRYLMHTPAKNWTQNRRQGFFKEFKGFPRKPPPADRPPRLALANASTSSWACRGRSGSRRKLPPTWRRFPTASDAGGW